MKVVRDHTVWIMLDESEWFRLRSYDTTKVIVVSQVIATSRSGVVEGVTVSGHWILSQDGRLSIPRKSELVTIERLPEHVQRELRGRFIWEPADTEVSDL